MFNNFLIGALALTCVIVGENQVMGQVSHRYPRPLDATNYQSPRQPQHPGSPDWQKNGPQYQHPMAETPEPTDSASEDFVEGTTRLLEEWKERRSKMGNPEDVILVAGNTGAGKTTMTKFISGQELEAYKLNRKILIRDREGDISTNTTVVSKTIFPDLIMDRETNTAFFDLPGFYDTRNVSIEIANAFFMKQVAQSAKRVKFLFVVNHASLEEGQSRTDFPMFLKRISEYIRYPGKFSRSTALIATKVKDPYSPTQDIVDGIMGFIESVHGSAPDIFSDPIQLENSRKILEALLDDQNGTSPKIGIFRQPARLGPLSEMAESIECRRELREVLWNRTDFVEKTDDDFGVSLSGEAKHVVVKLAEKANQDIVTGVKTLGSLLIRHFKEQSRKESELYDSLDEMNRGFSVFTVTLEDVVTGRDGRSLRSGQEFDNLFRDALREIHFQGPSKKLADSILSSIKTYGERLDFFKNISSDSVTFKSSEWLAPLSNFSRPLRSEIAGVAVLVDQFVEKSSDLVAVQLLKQYRLKLNKSEPSVHLLRELDEDYISLQGAVEDIGKTRSIPNFGSKLVTLVRSLNVRLPENLLLPFQIAPTKSIDLNEAALGFASPYRPATWFGKMIKVVTYLSKARAQVETVLAGEEHKKAARQLESRLESFEKEALVNATLVAGLMAEKEKFYQKEAEQNENLNKLVEEQRTKMENMNDAYRAASANASQFQSLLEEKEKYYKMVANQSEELNRRIQEQQKSYTELAQDCRKSMENANKEFSDKLTTLTNDLRKVEADAREQANRLHAMITKKTDEIATLTRSHSDSMSKASETCTKEKNDLAGKLKTAEQSRDSNRLEMTRKDAQISRLDDRFNYGSHGGRCTSGCGRQGSKYQWCKTSNSWDYCVARP